AGMRRKGHHLRLSGLHKQAARHQWECLEYAALSLFFTPAPVGALPRKASLPFDVIIIRLMSHINQVNFVIFLI
ncbi:hypothetical protein ACOIC6_27610, partial [Klebsiella pneumoniae]|uniref:hypothetical protein n=1 Tax=Klebsiella pneumoniae TaxID=573 RepID=UPI003B5CA8D4